MGEQKSIWDKQIGETNRAYNAFLAYRNMGALRSLTKAAKVFYGDIYLPKSYSKDTQFRKWSRTHNWVARCEAYDIEQDKIFQVEQREAIREMNKRQATIGAAMQKKGITRLIDMDISELTPDQAARLTKTGVEIERPARGEATEITEHKGAVGVNIIKVDSAIAKKIGDEIAKQNTDTG